jgi:hypothetical protein
MAKAGLNINTLTTTNLKLANAATEQASSSKNFQSLTSGQIWSVCDGGEKNKTPKMEI